VGFDAGSKIKGLRILAVQKQVAGAPTPQGHPDAYGVPGQRVDLTMLYVDEKSTPEHPRDIDVMWFGDPQRVGGTSIPFAVSCFNPPGDLYYGCFQGFRPSFPGGPRDAGTMETADAGASDEGGAAPLPEGGPLEGGLSEAGLDAAIADALADRDAEDAAAQDGSTAGRRAELTSSYSIDLPEASQILKKNVPGNAAPYGLAFAFFAVCAGKLQLDLTVPSGSLPLVCKDAAGNVLGADDFVAGYTAIYVYDPHPADSSIKPISNNNPVVTGIQFAGPSSVPHCTASKLEDCPTFGVTALVDRNEQEHEIDEGVTNETFHEQSWIAYFATGGGFTHDLRLVTDATAGWNEDQSTDWHVPLEPGPVTIWAVVHDNRGGVAWTSTEINVE
jgi:hypothetical protein